MRRTSLAAAIATLALALALGACTTVEYVNPCYGAGLLIPTDATPEEVVEAANECIADGGDRKQGLTIRSAGHLRGENYDAAVADAEAAIAIDPNYADAWYYRAFAHAVLERFDQAERDFTRAIELKPDDLKAYSGRAYVKYFTKRYAASAADFKVALSETPEGLKAGFLYLAMRRANDPDALNELARQAEELDATRNPGVFPALFLGRVTIDQMLDIAIRTGTHKPHENETEAYFNAGMAELFAGNREAAKAWFEKTLATGVTRFDETRGARMELRDMGIAVPSPDPEARASTPPGS